MKNKNLVPEMLVRKFMMGQLSVSEEKTLLNWIDQSPQHEKLFREEQKRLSPFISGIYDANVDEQWRQLSLKIQKKQTIRKNQLKKALLRFQIPAAALLIFALVCYWVLERNAGDSSATFATTVSTQNGERTSFLLPDGTKVSLNSNSQLMFPEEFTGNLRQVELSGEAFFEVTPKREAPFIVHTTAMDVRVLGTAFNVEAFPGAPVVNTTLVHGKVTLESEIGHETTTLAELNPYERVTFHVDNHQVEIHRETNLEQYIGWKDGKLVFLNSSIEEVAKKLELWYDVSVQIHGESLKRLHFTATFTNETIEQVLNLLKISYPFEYRIEKLTGMQNGGAPELRIILDSTN